MTVWKKRYQKFMDNYEDLKKFMKIYKDLKRLIKT